MAFEDAAVIDDDGVTHLPVQRERLPVRGWLVGAHDDHAVVLRDECSLQGEPLFVIGLIYDFRGDNERVWVLRHFEQRRNRRSRAGGTGIGLPEARQGCQGK